MRAAMIADVIGEMLIADHERVAWVATILPFPNEDELPRALQRPCTKCLPFEDSLGPSNRGSARWGRLECRATEGGTRKFMNSLSADEDGLASAARTSDAVSMRI